MKSDEKRKRHHYDRRAGQIEYAGRYRRYMDDGSGDRRTVRHDCRSGTCGYQSPPRRKRPARLQGLLIRPSEKRQ